MRAARRIFPTVAKVLPADVRTALVEASRINPDVEFSTPRIIAINKAATAARQKYPHLFKTEGVMP
jgi:hypothetical protein